MVNGPDSPVRVLRKKPCQRPVTSRSTAVGAQPRLGSDSRAAAASANGSIRLVVTRGKETFILPSFLKAPSAGISPGPLIRALGWFFSETLRPGLGWRQGRPGERR